MPDITGRKNSEIQRLRRLIKDGALRRCEGEFVCHGTQSLFEALKSGAFVTKVYGVKKPELDFSAPFVSVSQEVLNVISDVENTSDVVFTVKMRPNEALAGKRLIALEDVRDPGNVGTVIRTADAFGIDGVVLIGSCADPYSPKTVRSTAGSIFRTRLFISDLSALSCFCRNEKLPLYAAALDKNAEKLSECQLSECCVLIGNEAHGLSENAKSAALKTLFIPIESAESLNAGVAASIFMWEMRRKK